MPVFMQTTHALKESGGTCCYRMLENDASFLGSPTVGGFYVIFPCDINPTTLDHPTRFEADEVRSCID
jgi:hypothetical protein